MVTPINKKGRIDLTRLGKGHEVQSTATRIGPTRQMGELDADPTLTFGELDCSSESEIHFYLILLLPELLLRMSSSSNVQKNCDVEMAEATGAGSSAPPAAGEVPAHIAEFLSFQSELARCDAEGMVKPARNASPQIVALNDALTSEPSGSSTTPVRVVDAETAPESMPPPAKRSIVVGLPAVVPKSRKRPSANPDATRKRRFQPSGSSTTPVRVVDAETAPESMPPPAKRSIVVGLPAVLPKSRKRPSANPDATRKRRCEEAGPLPTKASGSGSASRHRVKFVSLIGGMISECGSEVERFAKELEESRENSSQLEGKLKVIEDAHSLEAARFQPRIGELERDLGKTASSLLKAKEGKTAKSSELRWLKRKIKSGEESSVGAIREAMRAELQIRLSRIADSLDYLAAVHVRDLALAGVEGGTNEVGHSPQSPRAEEAALPVRRAELVEAEGDFDLILVGLKSECVLLSYSGEPAGQDLIAEDAGGSVALNLEGVIGEGEAPRAEDD
ncbi:hypothetical protein F2Q70_00017055 [Brassica cretica]|uniref:Uncharacterized protein n=1 Tax=Brassica cretica TaxID=69181 RepID=A0A8S9HWK0_BRACR|nr:hypothetical protein F2Q70_00017055 [Brassica cretica]